jgi:CBS domain-containing protein
MAKLVEEIMNREVFALRPEEPAEQALDYILQLGITGAPVTDRDQRVLGHASFRDLLSKTKGALVRDRMKTPVEVVSPSTPIDEAGRRMARLRVHRLIVTEESRVVGVVSALDVVAALLGMPVGHPAAFPHFDRSTGTTWTDEAELTLEGVEVAPAGPGVFVLIEGNPLHPDWILWMEASSNVRTRLYELLSAPQDDVVLARIVEHPDKVRFRAAAVMDEGERRRILEQLRRTAQRWPASAFHCETDQPVARPLTHSST